MLTPYNLWWAWNWDLLILLGLLATALLYHRGVNELWQRAGPGRGIRFWQAGAFVGGLVALFVALISPLDALGHALFSAHMAQHLLLIQVAAPLIVLGAPHIGFQWALPSSWRRSIGRWWSLKPGATNYVAGYVAPAALRGVWRALTHPLVAWVLHSIAMWLWHLPSLYQAALRSAWIHGLEHACFFGTALLFWWAICQPSTQHRLGYGAGVFYVFTMMMQSGVLGAVITFAPRPWYADYVASAPAWGITPLEDQQLAGLIMWVPASIIYMVAALTLFVAWLRIAERAAQRNERQLWNAIGREETM